MQEIQRDNFIKVLSDGFSCRGCVADMDRQLCRAMPICTRQPVVAYKTPGSAVIFVRPVTTFDIPVFANER